ncbi:hypothetical protein V8C44DRAFT_66244 [Trichoderma aethiopicum]
MISADSMRDAMQHHDCHIPPLPIPRHDDANLEDPRLTYSQHVTHEHPDSSISNRTSPSSSPHKASPLSLRNSPVRNATQKTHEAPRNHRLKGKRKKRSPKPPIIATALPGVGEGLRSAPQTVLRNLGSVRIMSYHGGSDRDRERKLVFRCRAGAGGGTWFSGAGDKGGGEFVAYGFFEELCSEEENETRYETVRKFSYLVF